MNVTASHQIVNQTDCDLPVSDTALIGTESHRVFVEETPFVSERRGYGVLEVGRQEDHQERSSVLPRVQGEGSAEARHTAMQSHEADQELALLKDSRNKQLNFPRILEHFFISFSSFFSLIFFAKNFKFSFIFTFFSFKKLQERVPANKPPANVIYLPFTG